MSGYPAKQFTVKEKRIAARLADPAVDQGWARKWIEARKLEVQAQWTRNERQLRAKWALGQPVETAVVGTVELRGAVRRKTTNLP
jgi:hypothetical protein